MKFKQVCEIRTRELMAHNSSLRFSISNLSTEMDNDELKDIVKHIGVHLKSYIEELRLLRDGVSYKLEKNNEVLRIKENLPCILSNIDDAKIDDGIIYRNYLVKMSIDKTTELLSDIYKSLKNNDISYKTIYDFMHSRKTVIMRSVDCENHTSTNSMINQDDIKYMMDVILNASSNYADEFSELISMIEETNDQMYVRICETIKNVEINKLDKINNIKLLISITVAINEIIGGFIISQMSRSVKQVNIYKMILIGLMK